MLDFQKLMLQIDQVGKDTLLDRFPQEKIVQEAEKAYMEASSNPSLMQSRLQENAGLVLWPVAQPLEPIGSKHQIAPATEPVTVVATDGSQIMPSHHEIYNCYLLNIGLVVISYGAKFRTILETHPRLYHRPEDLYPLVDRRRFHIDELYVSLERNLLELEMLADTAIAVSDRGLPVVALLDGTLIPWSVEKMSDSYQTSYLSRMQAAMDSLSRSRIPLAGYLSHSRAADLINDLRIWSCPYPLSKCRELCGHLNEEDFPCSKIWPLSDRVLMSRQLSKSQRSSIFLSGASISRVLARQQRICFSYVHVGSEVARLEFPRWLVEDQSALDLLFKTAMAQSAKGMGYPVALSEAHNLAVIRGQDRSRFFDLLGRHLVAIGADRVKISPKESRKRKGII